MRLHDRYLFRELLTPLAICLGGFLVFWVSFFFFKDLEKIQESKLDLFDTAEYCAASLPGFLVPVLPILLLLALLYALTHHARYNEITALRAAGVSLWRVCVPYFVLGLLATVIYFGLNEIAVPACDRWAGRILDRHAQPAESPKDKTPAVKGFSNARAHRLWQFVACDPGSTSMQNPTVTWTRADGSWRALQAESAVRTNGVWTFFQVQLFTQTGPHSSLVRSGSTNILTIPEFDETPERIRLLIKFGDTQTLHGSGSADIPLADLWEFRQTLDLRPEDARAVETKFQGRLAMPWTCCVVVLMAIPFGAQTGRRNLFFGVAGSIFIVFAYFVLQRLSLALGMNGQLPGWLAAWLPNLIFAAAGLALTLRVR